MREVRYRVKSLRLRDLRRRDKPSCEETTGGQIGNPLATDIDLSPGDRLDVGCIHDEQGEGTLEDRADGFPKDAGAFHSHMGSGIGLQPVGQDHYSSVVVPKVGHSSL